MGFCFVAAALWALLGQLARGAIIDDAELAGFRYYLTSAASWRDSEAEAQRWAVT
jgi:hypothetical protein